MVSVKDYFDVFYGNSLELYNLEADPYGINYISRTSNNNGVSARVKLMDNIAPNPAYSITVAVGGSVMESFLQKEPYYTGFHILCLKPKDKLTEKQLFYYCMCLRANKYRYNFGRQANKTLKDLLIPSIDEIPKWVEKTVIPMKPNRGSFVKNEMRLNAKNWGQFKLNTLFFISGSQTTPLLELEDYGKGNYPYVTTQASNNGVDGFYNYYSEDGNVLTVDSAVLGYCSYQSLNFSASDHVEKLTPKFKMNKYIAMFLVAIINKEQYRYNYGRKCSQTRMENIVIKLPSKYGKPDWEFMENYIKTLPYSKSL